MASNSGWTTGLPSGNSLVANTDEEFRSLKSFQEAWWEQEHYATSGSATSAGVHKQGSARAFVQAAAPSSEVVRPAGQLWVDTDDDGLYYHNGSSWVLMTNSITLGSAQSWTGLQQFMAGSLNSLGEQLSPNREYLRFSDENITSSASALAQRYFWGGAGANEYTQAYLLNRAGSITGISATFNANIVAGDIDFEPYIQDPASAAAISAVTFNMDNSAASRHGPVAGHVYSHFTTAGQSGATFAAGALMGLYTYGSGTLNPSGSGDLIEVVVEVTYDD